MSLETHLGETSREEMLSVTCNIWAKMEIIEWMDRARKRGRKGESRCSTLVMSLFLLCGLESGGGMTNLHQSSLMTPAAPLNTLSMWFLLYNYMISPFSPRRWRSLMLWDQNSFWSVLDKKFARLGVAGFEKSAKLWKKEMIESAGRKKLTVANGSKYE